MCCSVGRPQLVHLELKHGPRTLETERETLSISATLFLSVVGTCPPTTDNTSLVAPVGYNCFYDMNVSYDTILRERFSSHFDDCLANG